MQDRTHPSVVTGDATSANALRSAYQATRAILRAHDPDAAQQAVLVLCRELGAEVVPADSGVDNALPLDVSLGEGEPLPPATSDPQVADDIRRYLVPAVADARTVVERTLSSERLVESATREVR